MLLSVLAPGCGSTAGSGSGGTSGGDTEHADNSGGTPSTGPDGGTSGAMAISGDAGTSGTSGSAGSTDASDGGTGDTGDPETNEGVWYRTCDIEDPFGQPQFSSDIVVPKDGPSQDVFDFAQLQAAVQDSAIQVIHVRGDAFSSSQRLEITEADSTASTRYIVGEDGGFSPSLHFDGASNWTVTNLAFKADASPSIPPSNSQPSSRSSISVLDGENLMFDQLSRTWGGGGETFLVIGNRRSESVTNLTLQRSRLEWSGGVSEFMGVIYRSWLSDMDESDFFGNGGNTGWNADSEDIFIQDNVMLGMGDGVQIQSEPFTSANVNRHYERNDHRNFTVRGNLFTSGPDRTAENAIDFKASSQTPELPARIYSNVFYGYAPVSGGGTSASGSAVIVHLRNQHVDIYENLFLDSSVGLSLKAFDGQHSAHDNVFVDVDTVLNMDAYGDGQDAVQLMTSIPSATLERNVIVGDTTRIADVGIGTSNRIDGVLTFNENFVESVAEFGFPDSGTSVIDGSATAPFSGQGNIFSGSVPSDAPGSVSEDWLGTAVTLTTRVGPCPDGATYDFQIPSLAALPPGLEDFFWAL
ncbi:MAG: hypothetical protein JKY37_15395 [Nannocystaceae bacterium]|nr:hypothetical protein [Nannocystaceae bacterium]